MWVAEDRGAWEGTRRDWQTTHKFNFLKYSRNFDVVVQAGGNCGLYPRLFANHFKVVYTFEPDSLNFHCLVNNCQQDNIIKFNAALGRRAGLVSVNKNSLDNVGMHTVSELPRGYVPMITIDSLNLTACDLIQLDVEGTEREVLEGAIHTITKFKPTISCENGSAVGRILRLWGYSPAKQISADMIFVHDSFHK